MQLLHLLLSISKLLHTEHVATGQGGLAHVVAFTNKGAKTGMQHYRCNQQAVAYRACCCRLGGLAYVVAFANKGAKDVTQRYVGSVLAADKMRDNAWWEHTLKPLRKHEVSTQHRGTALGFESMLRFKTLGGTDPKILHKR